jgi:hypothetical protein
MMRRNEKEEIENTMKTGSYRDSLRSKEREKIKEWERKQGRREEMWEKMRKDS